MRRRFRLSKRNDFKPLFTDGKRIESSLFRLAYRRNLIGHVRLALVTSRSVDKRATVRNRLRRRAKEWLRAQEERMRQPLDVAIIFKKEAAKAPRKKFYEELKRSFNRVSCL
jgi:ribonuclease P protein component